MQTNVRYSIQEYLKKINTSLSFYDCLSIFATSILLFGLVIYSKNSTTFDAGNLQYRVGESGVYTTYSASAIGESRPFASKNGKTYTFSWCQGGNRIRTANKIYFETEASASASGRTLSKLCKK